ncbi:glycoside hydrolase family 9 protein [Maritalea sp.]|jgi:hypothetical protein|uniref:glycoside hydrolase family 9 protein n=1 Tax=Maritalea sp. TaxID=2003361 RepID=UPI0039E324FB
MNELFPALRDGIGIAINHVGYEAASAKHAVISLGDQAAFDKCEIWQVGGLTPTDAVQLGSVCTVDGWDGLSFQQVDFTSVQDEGRYYLRAKRADGSELLSEQFGIQDCLFTPELVPLVLSYFKSQRCADQYDEADKSVPFVGNKKNSRADVHGGWYDASGDVSKYLSHLSYANYMNPQQTPLVVWSLARASQNVGLSKDVASGLANEAAYGADFLVRMCDVTGAFYMTVFDKWTGDINQREICAYATQLGHKSDDWQAGYRQGGGMAIAALALAARLDFCGEFGAAKYLNTAKRAFEHLEIHNVDYLDDGEENIIDDYCALLAAIELFKATHDLAYHNRAQYRAVRLLERLQSGHGYDGWFRADDDGNRPFSHAADEGMPLMGLVEYLSIADENEARDIVGVLEKAVTHILNITNEVNNPFAYPRQLANSIDGEIKSQFFYPHVNESGYWWQGENARLASLAYGLRRVEPYLEAELAEKAEQQAQRMLDWILGANPYHSCMMQGVGRNVAQYEIAKFPNVDGGICNGITSGMAHENDIAFCETEDPYQSWRWGEQWLPHAAWFLLAITA